MKNLFINLLLIFTALVGVSCSKHGVTPAKIKLRVGNMIASSVGGIGSGGGILFGKSDSGEVFGKVIGPDDTMDLANGVWVFQAFLWEAGDGRPMSGTVYCGKVAQKLTGVEASINMDLTNGNCADADFSSGQSYYNAATGKIHFSDLFIDECDDLDKSLGFSCGLANQGSALSYRLIFRNFRKAPGSAPIPEGGVLVSACQKINRADPTDLLHKGMALNFPSGPSGAPYVVSIEMYLGNDSCSPDGKGIHTIVLDQGINGQSSVPEKVVRSNNLCTTGAAAFTGTNNEKKLKCDNIFGSFNGSACLLNDIPDTISRFMSGSDCLTNAPANLAIKHMVSIPKSFICDRYENLSNVIGSHPFAGGNGSVERPYKICNEWQINQIGEVGAPNTYYSSSYKLMNDLDMNKADFLGPYAKPICAKASGSILDLHHNLNSLDGITNASCTVEGTSGFSGNFNGNGKIIKNARIASETTNLLGFTRKLINGSITNLIFNNLEVHGAAWVGGLAAEMDNSQIKNIWINKLDVESKTFAGGISSVVYNTTSLIDNVHINEARLKGETFIGGLVGDSEGQISNSHFRGRIDNYKSATGIGGLVGRNATASSSVTRSFAEGSIYSSALYTGGVVAVNNGVVDNVYSTMSIITSPMMNSVYLGGTIGSNESSGHLTNSIFDGVLRADGATPHLDGAIANATGPRSTCYASYNLTYSTSISGCTTVTYGNLRGVQYLTSNPNWMQTTGSIPRLYWEYRECLLPENEQSVAGQVSASGRGTATNPIVICTTDQLTSIGGRASGEFYRVAEDINLSSFAEGNLISNFAGNLDGSGKIFYGLYLSLGSHAATTEGIFKNIVTNSNIKNLNFYGNTLINTVATSDTGTAIVAGVNNGTIKDVDFFGNKLSADSYAGLVAGQNYKDIYDIDTNNDQVSGNMFIGGIAGLTNAGIITKINSNVSLTNTSGNYNYFGGIVGKNLAPIDQVRYNGNFNFTAVSSATPYAFLGGITGFNNSTISNSFLDKNAILRVKNYNKVGGLVGENSSSGFIKSSFSVGKLIYDNGGIEAAVSNPFNPLVGNNIGAINPNVFYLENNMGSVLTTSSTSAACTGSGTFSCVSANSIASGAAFLLLSSDILGGDLLGSMTPFSGTGYNFSYVGSLPLPASTPLAFVKNYTIGDESKKRTIASFSAVSTFCSGWSGAIGNDTCSDLTGEYDIANFESAGVTPYGQNRLYSYYLSRMNYLPTPSDAPIWELDVHDGYPKLLQLKNH